ncbi:hypothetical protein NDU88_002968 [Pleurodeles waltl]|uniref:HAT C-terminal dimerisation domain-containing protein n=1 Tax=Pleurodeles waltl TaxID=8319 RepID=A0AAV7VC38_PLEWA|nr:hypothetical protein NDU88_002968 [Pleurodeles waltl]
MSPTCQRLAYGFTRSQRDYVLQTFGIYRRGNSEESTGTGVLLPLRSSALRRCHSLLNFGSLGQKYFPEDEVEPIKWVRDPFNAEIPQHFNNEEAEQLIDISSDSTLKVQFQSLSLLEFWCQTQDEYPVISKIALRVLIPFATSYLCEAGFSAVAVIKSKYRAKIHLEKEMRVAISKITPRFEELCKEKQAHPSH